MHRRLLTGLVAFAIAGCASAPPAPAPTVDVTGSWAGNWGYEQATLGGGQMELTIKQTGANVEGMLQMSGTPQDRNGPFSGVVSGNEMRILYPTSVTGRLTVQGDTMSGILDGSNAARMTLNKVKK